jgi:hypothetical protein
MVGNFNFLRNWIGLEEHKGIPAERTSQSEDDNNFEPTEESDSDEVELVEESEEDIKPINLEEYMKVRHLF